MKALGNFLLAIFLFVLVMAAAFGIAFGTLALTGSGGAALTASLLWLMGVAVFFGALAHKRATAGNVSKTR